MIFYALIGVAGVEIVNERKRHAKVCEVGGGSENLHGSTMNHSGVLVVGPWPVEILMEQSTEGCWISVHVCFDMSGKTKGHETNLTHGQLQTRVRNIKM